MSFNFPIHYKFLASLTCEITSPFPKSLLLQSLAGESLLLGSFWVHLVAYCWTCGVSTILSPHWCRRLILNAVFWVLVSARHETESPVVVKLLYSRYCKVPWLQGLCCSRLCPGSLLTAFKRSLLPMIKWNQQVMFYPDLVERSVSKYNLMHRREWGWRKVPAKYSRCPVLH